MICLNCGNEFLINENWKQDKKRKFCSNSCSASFNNRIRYKKIVLSETDFKKCSICNKDKNINDFYKRKGSVDGYRNDCKVCLNFRTTSNPDRKNNKKIYYQKNKEKIKEKVRNYSLKNKENILDKKKIYQQKNKIKRRKYLNSKYENDLIFRLTTLTRGIISKAFKRKGWKKTSKTYELLGCSYEELKIHLENQFKDNMNWDNRSKWHIDHKIPLSWAKNEEDLNKLCHYTNLQPLWATENMSKKNYYSN